MFKTVSKAVISRPRLIQRLKDLLNDDVRVTVYISLEGRSSVPLSNERDLLFCRSLLLQEDVRCGVSLSSQDVSRLRQKLSKAF